MASHDKSNDIGKVVFMYSGYIIGKGSLAAALIPNVRWNAHVWIHDASYEFP